MSEVCMKKLYGHLLISIIIVVVLLAGCSRVALPLPSEEPSEEPTATPEVTYKAMKPLARSDYSYFTTANGEVIEDEPSLEIPGFMDLLSFSKVIDDDSITVTFELRELPSELGINLGGASGGSLEYSWRINFDTGSDGGLEYDITLAHYRYAERGVESTYAAADGNDFITMAHQHQVTSGKDIAEGSVSIEGNTMTLRFDKSLAEELLGIHEDTPVHILLEYWSPDGYMYELLP